MAGDGASAPEVIQVDEELIITPARIREYCRDFTSFGSPGVCMERVRDLGPDEQMPVDSEITDANPHDWRPVKE